MEEFSYAPHRTPDCHDVSHLLAHPVRCGILRDTRGGCGAAGSLRGHAAVATDPTDLHSSRRCRGAGGLRRRCDGTHALGGERPAWDGEARRARGCRSAQSRGPGARRPRALEAPTGYSPTFWARSRHTLTVMRTSVPLCDKS